MKGPGPGVVEGPVNPVRRTSVEDERSKPKRHF